MSGLQKQLYHCDRCGEVFRSSIKEISDLTCTECGKSPIRDGFAQLAQMPVLDHSLLDSNHGIAGKDEADFFSMERKRKQKRAIIMYASWFMLLVVTLGVGLYVKKSHDEREEEREAINKESVDYEKRRSKAAIACMRRFQAFGESEGENEKARHIYDGTDYLVGIKRYYTDVLNKEEYKSKKLNMLRANLVEEAGKPSRMDLLIEIDYKSRYDQVFEAVFWQKDDQWYLDWPQFTRIGEMDWSNYIENSNLKGEFKFRVYARMRRNEFKDDNGYTELVSSKSVLVKRDTELETEILEYIELRYNKLASSKESLRQLSADTAGQARANVRVAHEELNGERVIVLKGLIAKDWFSEVEGTEDVKK